MSDLLPVDDQQTMTTSEPLYPPPEPAVALPALRENPVTVVPATAPAAATELISCPECGTTAMVTLNRREARDFCRHCDYPLFWTPSKVLHDRDTDANDLALRRLPGTVGRATIASLACPHCAEPNAVTAELCVRCGLPMTIEAPPPPPEPVYVPPPPPEPVYVEPERGVPWWAWALIGIALAATIALVVLILTGTIG